MTRHFCAAIVRQALTQKGRQLLHLTCEALQRILSRAAVHAAQHDETRLTLHQCAHAGAIKSAFDEVALPMSRPLPQFDLLGPIHDAQILGHETALSKARTPTPARRLFLAQGVDHRLLEPAARMRIDRGVNRFVADALVGFVGIHPTKSGSNLLRRPAPVDQPVMYVLIKLAAGNQFSPTHAVFTPRPVCHGRTRGVIVGRRRLAVSLEFPCHRRSRTTKHSSNRRRARVLRMFNHDYRAFLRAQMPVVLLHRNTLHHSRCCT
ncbi:hypothetical protein PSO31014_04457 [Pandoraea soli]|uniref:Uncharacterized protein n=1 Tax=Pandoraea soli TaxID=2508293 RepID=A0ABY6WAU7_9BURK|nr:hypothetical protein PSO31014_04457 [Pandoraea soli]